ncbi:MAG: PTS fructose transporter subunit IIB [Clostridium sp.]|uniref:PTS fructose transporter subunit IIB n=1 Tax=Clostridium sp. TaxID=1506 RepID=UPI00290D1CA4|nr:PTS fructose transporter subunit IIB [Clostridium sp.]MDU5109798.1 PTS fructose transporter subunit IIB [Clostridium sp.]
MKIVGVTACPTGIAHTYMVARGLEKVAKELGHEIAIEKQGALGIEDELTAEQIREADVVIFATATGAQREERFEGKDILDVEISEALKSPKEIILEAVNG